MFGNKKKKILQDGISARAVVIGVADTGMTVNDNPRVKLTLQVQPEGDAPFEATKKVTVSRVAIPSVGDQYYVRGSTRQTRPTSSGSIRNGCKEANQAARSEIAQAAWSASVPDDLAQTGILGARVVRVGREEPRPGRSSIA